MTREEAVDYLIRPVITSTVPGSEYVKQVTAWSMAVRALLETSSKNKENCDNCFEFNEEQILC